MEMSDGENVIDGLIMLKRFIPSTMWGPVNEALALLKEQPEIVRCKDCKYCEYPDAEKEWCKKGHLHRNAETWFCADGERQEVNESEG